ncbi:MAG: aldehyde dehydrogenase family protein [Pseudomonadales bacterium]|nr:aldehyde dehydrogenase family protein [Pseudomonadales bacterium]
MSQIILHDPFTGKQVFAAKSESFEKVAEKAEFAQRTGRAWAKLDVAIRARAVREALTYFEQYREDIAAGITREMGKPVKAAAEELDYMLERARWLCDFAEHGALDAVDLSRYWDANFQGRIEYRAKGVVYIITPWNYPLFCAINGSVCALLAGSAVLLKHSTTPSVGEHFQRAFGTMAGIAGLMQHVLVDFSISARLIEEAAIDHVVFTGSVRGGREIATSVARRCYQDVNNPFIQCSLELGSNDAAYIAEDADLDHAALWAVKIGRLHNSGQSCCAVKRVYCHHRVHDDFIARAKAIMAAEVSGDPMQDDTTLGPLFGGIDAIAGLQKLINEACEQGADLVTGGTVETIGTCHFLQPTLLKGCNHTMDVMREETFGPVLPVMRVDSDEQAIELVSDTRYGLTSSIFTRSRARAESYIKAMHTGTVYVNACNYVDARVGWIGHRHSGNGSIALSPLGLQAYSGLYSVNINPALLDD